MRYANFTDAIMVRTNLTSTGLEGAIMHGSNMTDAILLRCRQKSFCTP